MNEPIEIPMARKKECKHSIVFESADPKAVITNVYVSRDMPGIDKAQNIVVLVGIPQPS
jgi:hypothetical protein